MSDAVPPEQAQLSDADNAALLQHIERTIPPMDIDDAGRLLDEAKQIFDAQGMSYEHQLPKS